MGFQRRSFAKALPRRTPGAMNKTELDYQATLALRMLAGEVQSCYFEAVAFKLAPDVRYTPDFMVIMPDGRIEFHEVKGTTRSKATGEAKPYVQDDARVKFRVAAEIFYQFRFAVAYKVNGAWRVEYAD